MTEQQKYLKYINKEIENSKDLFEITMNLIITGNTTGKQMFEKNMKLNLEDCSIFKTPGITEYKCWFNNRIKTPMSIVDIDRLSPRGQKKFQGMFYDTVAIVVSLNVGDFDELTSSGSLKFLKLQKHLKNMLRIKALSNASIILVLYKVIIHCFFRK